MVFGGVFPTGDFVFQPYHWTSEQLLAAGVLSEQLKELQHIISIWNGTWKESGEKHYQALLEIQGQLHRFHGSDDYHQALILECFFAIKVNLSRFIHQYIDSGRIGSLNRLAKTQNPWGSAAAYTLGRIYSNWAALPRWNQSERLQLTELSFRYFDSIRDHVVLPSEVLLPGVRSEAYSAMLIDDTIDREPLIQVVPVPHRYRAIRAVSAAHLARSLAMPEKTADYLEKARASCSESQKHGGASDQIVINITICELMSIIIDKHRGWTTKSHKLIAELFEHLERSKGRLPEVKRLEFLAACHASLACASRKKALRTDNLDALHNLVRQVTEIRPAQAPSFRIDPVYDLAHAEDRDALQAFEFILDGSGRERGAGAGNRPKKTPHSGLLAPFSGRRSAP